MLRFENLGAPENDWQGRALAEVLKRQFGNTRQPRAASPAPGIASERLAALNAGAEQLIYGSYRTEGGAMRVTAYAEDPATGKLTGPLPASGGIEAVARQLASELKEAGTPAAAVAESPGLREYAIASDLPSAQAAPHYERALELDPRLAPAYLDLMRAYAATGDAASARHILERASAHTETFTKEEKAALQLEQAAVSGDVRARAAALEAAVATGTKDANTFRALGDAEMALRKPADAARHYREAAALAPEDPNLRNLLAYAALFAGDEKQARSAAEEYQKLRPEDPNVYDTRGDIELALGHFAEAEKAYLSGPDRKFQNYLPSWKAAHARFAAGDVAGASALAKQHTDALRAAGSELAGYRAAQWLADSGHRKEAAGAMAQFASGARQPAVRAAAFSQAALWAVFEGDRANAVPWSNQALKTGQQQTLLFAALSRFLAQPDVSASEWQARAEKVFSGPNATAVRRLSTGLALLVGRHFEDALPVWKQIYEASPVTDTGSMYLYGWALLETGHKAEAAPLLRLVPIPSPGIVPSYEALYSPAALEWRKLSLRQ